MGEDVNAPENNAWRGKTAWIMRPSRRHPTRDNKTKTNNLESVINEEGIEEVDTLEMQQDKTRKVLEAGEDRTRGSLVPAHLPFLSGLSYRRIEESSLLAAPRAGNLGDLLVAGHNIASQWESVLQLTLTAALVAC